MMYSHPSHLDTTLCVGPGGGGGGVVFVVVVVVSRSPLLFGLLGQLCLVVDHISTTHEANRNRVETLG